MIERIKKTFEFGILGILFGILVIVLSIVWVAMLSLSKDDDKTCDEITWIG